MVKGHMRWGYFPASFGSDVKERIETLVCDKWGGVLSPTPETTGHPLTQAYPNKEDVGISAI